MPEGPEVKRTAEGLARAISGKKLINVNILSGRYLKESPGGYEDLKSRLPIDIVGAGCHGKFIFAICKEETFIWSTLGMTGYWNATGGDYARVQLEFRDGSSVYFNDMRNFGTLKFVRGKHEMLKKLKSLGPDMLAEDVSNHRFKERLMQKPKWSLAKALMKQTLVCGVGNYVKADALWLAKLSPHRKIESLSDIELNTLNSCIKKVIRTAYEQGGATIQSYVSFDGQPGTYTQNMIVYGQKTDPLGNLVTREKTDDGRTTHWVPSIQK